SSSCKYIDEEIHRREIHQSGKKADLGNFPVRNTCHLSHQESACTHHGRHDLTSGTGGSLNSCGFMPAVAHTPHQWNREGCSGYDICDSAARNGSHEGRAQHSCFSRSSPSLSSQRVGKIHEKVTSSRDFQECAEQDEDEDKIYGDAEWKAK